jgi:putative acyl-CoA dehydrogenase
MKTRLGRSYRCLSIALIAAVVVAAVPPPVDAFGVSRLGQDGGRAFGTLPARLDLAGIAERAALVR